jgi:hypothetical protein
MQIALDVRAISFGFGDIGEVVNWRSFKVFVSVALDILEICNAQSFKTNDCARISGQNTGKLSVD